jgi:hypothetical protein
LSQKLRFSTLGKVNDAELNMWILKPIFQEEYGLDTSRKDFAQWRTIIKKKAISPLN